MPQSLGLPHRYFIFQSPNNATVENTNRFAPLARAGQFRRFSLSGEASLESRVIRSSRGVVRCHTFGFIIDSEVEKMVARETCISRIIIVHPFFAPVRQKGGFY